MRFNKFIFILSIFIFTITFSSCNLLQINNPVVILDTKNGSLDVEVTKIESNKNVFEITAKPNEGYELLIENIFVNVKGNSSFTLTVNGTDTPNKFYFSYYGLDKIIISAYFTQK